MPAQPDRKYKYDIKCHTTSHSTRHESLKESAKGVRASHAQ